MTEEFLAFLNNNPKMKVIWERYLAISVVSEEARKIEKTLKEEFWKGERDGDSS